MKSNANKFRTIAHIRLPDFCSSVEEALRPALRTRPFAVCGYTKNRYVVTCANGFARMDGIHNGMTLDEAAYYSPNTTFLHGSIRIYESFSREFFSVLRQFSKKIEPTSVSSAFIELEGFEQRWISAERACREIVRIIARELEINASIGVAGNKVTAEVASKTTAPGSVTSVAFGTERAFLAPLPLNLLPGIGGHTAKALNYCGLRAIGDLTRVPYRELTDSLGTYGLAIWQLAHALDGRPVKGHQGTHSISSSLTLSARAYEFNTTQQIICDRLRTVYRRMKSQKTTGKTAFLRIQCADGSFATRQKTFPYFSNDYAGLRTFVLDALNSLVPLRAPIQSICVGLKNLEHGSACIQNFERHIRSAACVRQSFKHMEQTLGMSTVLRKSKLLRPESQKKYTAVTQPYMPSPQFRPVALLLPS
ncbi:MAG: hypothetical protein PHY34_02310 [Patescibacteria group bacterium]|nr:hypothetical protein [Patescibacteria group bacterium]MDD5715232.1 hypothetical protein [Patescibacteria group bacterium]